MMSDVFKTLARSSTDLTFARGFSFERSQVIAPVVKLKYDVPKTPPHQIRYKRKLVLPVPVEQKISHRHSLRLLKSNTFLNDNPDCALNGDGQKVTGVGFGKISSADVDGRRNKAFVKEIERQVKSACEDSKLVDRSKLTMVCSWIPDYRNLDHLK